MRDKAEDVNVKEFLEMRLIAKTYDLTLHRSRLKRITIGKAHPNDVLRGRLNASETTALPDVGQNEYHVRHRY